MDILLQGQITNMLQLEVGEVEVTLTVAVPFDKQELVTRAMSHAMKVGSSLQLGVHTPEG